MLGVWFNMSAAHAQGLPCDDPQGFIQSLSCVSAIRSSSGIRDFAGRPEDFVAQFVRAILVLVAVLATGAIVAGGIMYITSLGNEEKTRRAKMIILFAIIGLIAAILSVLITNVVINVFAGP